MKAKSSTLVTMIPAPMKVGRATEVSYFDAKGKERRQRAKAAVVCANGAETPQLLLLSKPALFPRGLANSGGQVGRNVMVDNGALAMGMFDQPLNEYTGIQVTRALFDYYDSDPKRGFLGRGSGGL